MKETQEQVFPCNFSDAKLSSRLFIWTLSIVYAVAILSASHNIAILLILGISVLLLPVIWEIMLYYIRTKSYILLTPDNEIALKVWSRRIKSYPIDHIERICVVDFDSDITDKLMKDYAFPVSFGRGGDDLIPDKGVLIFFQRRYIKSVRPVFFNPSDPELLADALKNRLKNSNNLHSHKS